MRLVVVVAALALVPALAAAQPGPDDPSPPGLTPPIAAPPPLSPVDQADRDDASADRAFGTSTGLVVPSGRVDMSARVAEGGALLSAAIGFDHGIEISGQIGGAHDVYMAGADLKIAVARTRTWALALDAGYHTLAVEDGGGGGFNVGAATSYVGDAGVLSFGAGLLGSIGGGATYYTNASFIIGRGAFRPIVEGALLETEMLGFAGARIGNGHVCVDLGVAGVGGDGTSGVGPLPLMGLTIRP
jgi:hypothetical protein